MLISGKKYAQVKDRVAEFHKMYPTGSIKTTYEVIDGLVVFRADVWKVDAQDFTKEGTPVNSSDFNGHALGKLTGGKTFEKTETIAVGRCLAFLGIQADGNIATYEEMEDIELDITQTDQYKDAQYRLEDLLERCDIVDESVESVRRDYGSYDLTQLYKAYGWLRDLMDEQRQGSGNTTAKERNKKVADKLADENA